MHTARDSSLIVNLVAGSLGAFSLAACSHFSAPVEKPQRYAESFAGDHQVLARCVTEKLSSDSRSFMRIMRFSNIMYSDKNASEIYAFDTRYLPGVFASNSPTNPDAIVDFHDATPEVQTYDQRNVNNQNVHAFALGLEQTDQRSVQAIMRGDSYYSDIAWKMLQSCAAAANP